MSVPKKGPGQYNDDFLVRRVEGGYVLSVQFTEQVEKRVDVENDAPKVHMILPPAMQAKMDEHTHTRTVVCKSVSEVIAHLREWTQAEQLEQELSS